MKKRFSGLTADAEAVFTVLVSRTTATITDLVDATGIDQPRVTEALDDLTGRGLTAPAPDRTGHYTATGCHAALRAWLDEQEARLGEWRARLEIEQDHLDATAWLARTLALRPTLHQASPGPEFIETVTGREAIVDRFCQLQDSTHQQMRAIDKPPYAAETIGENPDRQRELLERERRLLERGVRVRVIYDPAGLRGNDHALDNDMQPGVAAGEEARILAGSSTKMMLFDDRAALLPIESAPREFTAAVVVHPSALLDALIDLFERCWHQALPLHLPGTAPQAGPAGPDGPSREELRLLGLLTAGLTDEVIARHLDVSIRTAQRRLQTLQERLGARTRFQTAMHAIRRGWLPTQPHQDTNPDTNPEATPRTT